MNLDYTPETFQKLLHSAADEILALYQSLPERPVVQYPQCAVIDDLFSEPLPETEMDPGILLKDVSGKLFDTATLNISPLFFAYIMSGGTHIGIIGEMLAAALNQNVCKWHLAPGIIGMERTIIRWLSEFIGYNAEAGGILVSGGSMANLTCLSVARKVKAPWNVSEEGCSLRPLTVYTSQEAHSCHEKSIDLLGMGKKHLRKLPVHADLTIDVEALELKIQEDRASGCVPICIIGNAGTVNSGAIDPLDQLADLCEKYKLWFHVDGAYGAPAAGLPEMAPLFSGLQRADSIALDPHKWFFTPFEAGCALIRNGEDLHRTYSVKPDYLQDSSDDRFEPYEHIFSLSRDAKALKIWMTFKAYGKTRIQHAIRDTIAVIRHLRDQLSGLPDFEILADSPLSILCFRYVGNDPDQRRDERSLDEMNLQILSRIEQDGRIFLTGTKIHGKQALRVCCMNHRTTVNDIAQVIPVVREMAPERARAGAAH